MDSKPIAIVMSLVLTVGALGAVAVFAGDTLTGAMSATSMTPKTMQVIYVGAGSGAEANLVISNQGSGALAGGSYALLRNAGAAIGNLSHADGVAPYGTATYTGTLTDNATAATTVYPGDEIIVEINAETTSGELVRNLFTVTVR